MGDEAKEPQASGVVTANPSEAGATTTDAPAKKHPKGVILGKDGKPCRPCNSFAAFTSQTKSLKAATKTVSATPGDCPADVETLGRSSWTLLHSIAAIYPTTPTASDQSDIKSFMKLFAKFYPCWSCAEDFQEYIQKKDVRASSRDEFGNWLCDAHNEVNKKLGKPVFDCSKWEERWRTGWKDGRCD
ncbi:ERV/ALR sulfhydryl oxidase domain-containing protein [Rhypophila decipiens]|uniref:Sulfhydryl oxidase n=1 Tax=Rhypophila decipiens TaxID=261697 RepID=A0AAN6YE37_9PEZI|nr:ERV/ALR sulfhydryl oxidase domain-containing protein [Rhypophila decipiens]